MEIIKKFLILLIRKYTSQKQRYLGYWLKKYNLIPIDDSVRFFSEDYFNYQLKNKININLLKSYFPKKDWGEIDYFLRIYKKIFFKEFLSENDFEGRWEKFSKMRKYVGDNLKFNLLKNHFELFGFKSRVYPDTGVFPDNYYLDILKKRDHKICFDLGAYIGDTAYLINQILKPKKIYAFEPDRKNYQILLENIKINNLNRVVKPIKLATGKANGLVNFISQESGSFINTKNNKMKNSYQVRVVKIDDFVKKNNIKDITLIKMDVEGAEFDTLKGSINTIKRDKPDLIITIYHRGEHLFEIPPWLKKVVPEYNLRFISFDYASPFIERSVFASIKRI